MTTTSKFSFDPTEFVGKRALITGGTKGMGEAIVARLAAGGAKVATTARSPLPANQKPDVFIQADVSTREGAEKVISEVLERLGGVDLLVNNVGGSSAPGGGVLALSDEDWQQTINANLFAAVRLDRGLLPGMLKRGSGVIIHVSSIQRRLPLFEATLAYAASKAALTTYSRLVEGGGCKGYPREYGCSGLHRNRGCAWPDRPARRTGWDRRGRSAAGADGLARRNSYWPAWPPRRGCRIGRVPGLRAGGVNSRERVRH
jgi:short subunit dehydrogenase